MPATHAWLFPLAAVLLGGIGTLILVRGLFGRWFRAGGKRGRVWSCRKCRFDLSATDGHTCPECGHTARHEAEHYAGRFRWPAAALGLVLLLGAIGVGMTPGIQRDGWLHLLPMGVQVRVFHLESNDQSYWRFTERLEGRDPSPGASSGFQLSIYAEEVDGLISRRRTVAFSTAALVYARGHPEADPETKRAIHVLERYIRHGLSVAAVERLLQTRGIEDSWVKLALLAEDLEPTPPIRAARRALLVMWDDPTPVPGNHLNTARVMLARIIARADPDEVDSRALATYLVGTPGEDDIGSRGRNLSVDITPRV